VKPSSIHAYAILVNTAGPAPTLEAVLIPAHVLAAGLDRIVQLPSIHAFAILANIVAHAPTREAVLIHVLVLVAGLE